MPSVIPHVGLGMEGCKQTVSLPLDKQTNENWLLNVTQSVVFHFHLQPYFSSPSLESIITFCSQISYAN